MFSEAEDKKEESDEKQPSCTEEQPSCTGTTVLIPKAEEPKKDYELVAPTMSFSEEGDKKEETDVEQSRTCTSTIVTIPRAAEIETEIEIEKDVESSHHDDDDEEGCPICLTSSPTLAYACGPCQHMFCVPCLERVLNADASVARWPPTQSQDADAHLSAPTMGRCPICRAELCLFDVTDPESGEPLYPTNLDISTSPIADTAYVPYGRPQQQIGHQSFHFHLDNYVNNGGDSNSIGTDMQGRPRPYLNVEALIRANPGSWLLEDGTSVPPRKYMEEGCHFHAPSRTFHGKIMWGPSRFKGSYQWDVVLGFAKDFRFLSNGVILQRRELVKDASELPKEYTPEERERCNYPLDGMWTVVWYDSTGTEKRKTIVVAGNEYQQAGYSFYLNLEDPLHPQIRWPSSSTIQTAENGVHLIQNPMGPEVGGRILWTTPSPRFPRLYWIRQTIGKPPVPRTVLFGPGNDRSLYQKLHELGPEDESPIPKYHGDSIWGNVFVKKLRLGNASYHFLSPERGAYISYEHPACQELPPLDDGTPLPTRLYFHDINWDAEHRKFTGTIEWERDFGITWNDNVRWKLDMTFDSEFVCILKGGIQCEWSHVRRAPLRPRPPPPVHRPAPVPVYVPPPPPTEDQEAPPPERNEEWRMSGYGHDQLYMNAAIVERHKDMLMPQQASKSRYFKICQDLLKRLEGEGATERTRQMIEHIFRSSERPDSNVIDFNIS